MIRTAEVFNFAAVRDHRVAIAKVGIAGGDAARRIHASHRCIRACASHAASATMIDIGCRINLAPSGCIHVAIEVCTYALGELALARYARGNRCGVFTRLAAAAAMVEVGGWIGFAAIVIKIVAIGAPVVAAGNGACASDTGDVAVSDGVTRMVAHTAMGHVGGRIRFTNGVGIAVAFGESCGTPAASSTASTTRAP